MKKGNNKEVKGADAGIIGQPIKGGIVEEVQAKLDIEINDANTYQALKVVLDKAVNFTSRLSIISTANEARIWKKVLALHEARKAEGIKETQKDVADSMGVKSQGYVSDIFKTLRDKGLEAIVKGEVTLDGKTRKTTETTTGTPAQRTTALDRAKKHVDSLLEALTGKKLIQSEKDTLRAYAKDRIPSMVVVKEVEAPAVEVAPVARALSVKEYEKAQAHA